MPLIKSAKKKLRKDRKKTQRNKRYKATYQKLVNAVRKKKDSQGTLVSKLYSALDRAVKKNIIHKNKAARLKSLIRALVKKQ